MPKRWVFSVNRQRWRHVSIAPAHVPSTLALYITYYGALLGRREESAQQSRRSPFKFNRPMIRSRRSVMGALR
jgi:hypothetical protein